jgi:hypothetical protein
MVEKAFIFGRLTIDIFDKPGGTRYMSVSDILIRRTKDQSRFYPEVPQRRYQQGDETKYSNIVFLFPDNKDWWRKWTEKAIQDWQAECSKQGIQPGGWVGGAAPAQAPQADGPSFGGEGASAAAVPAETAPQMETPETDEFPF